MKPAPVESRRGFLGAAIAAGGGLLFRTAEAAPAEPCAPDPYATGRLIATLPLTGPEDENPLETLLGEGLDARFLTDLSTLSPDTLITPNERFYVRTAYPDRLKPHGPWRIAIRGLVRAPFAPRLDMLAPLSVPMGNHLMECAGNSNPNNFGLMSAARWAGIPIGRILDMAGPSRRATRVLVSGFDKHSRRSSSSTPGASWIFGLEELASSGAFLATQMNGAPLRPDHGAPVRLVVPRWYGCVCIKWVNEIRFVSEEARVTPHMREFATRTFQDGEPPLARDFRPATMGLSAMPVRIEKWLLSGVITYKVVGVVWGGARVTDKLRIRFDPGGHVEELTVCPAPVGTTTWSLWSRLWRPPAPGQYCITLRAAEPGLPAPRLEREFYARMVAIDEV